MPDESKKSEKPSLPSAASTAGQKQENLVAGTAADSTVLPANAAESAISEEMEIEVLYRRVEDLDDSSSTERVPDLSAVPMPLALATPPQPRNEKATTATSSTEDVIASSSSMMILTASEIMDLRKHNP